MKTTLYLCLLVALQFGAAQGNCWDDKPCLKKVRQELIDLLKHALEVMQTCDPIAETLDWNGDEPYCKKTTELVEDKDPCPCFCGTGTRIVRRECRAYHYHSDGSCEVKKVDIKLCGDFDEISTEPCSNGPCMVTKVVEQTMQREYAQSPDEIYYKGITSDNQVCDMGIVGKAPREIGQQYVWPLKFECDVCMKSADEKFAYLELYNPGNDAWIADWTEVTINGNVQKYYDTGFSKGYYLKFGNRVKFVPK